METLRNNIKVATLLALDAHVGDSTPIEGGAVDMYETSDGPAFDAALVTAVVGAIGADVSAATITIQEDDDSSFGSATTADGGDAVDVVAGDITVTFQISRSKRYIRAVLAITEDGAADTVEATVTAVLNNWAKPLPVVS